MDEFASKGPMPPPRNSERGVLVALGGLGLIGIASLVWQMAGWFGVGVFGLLVLFLSIRIDLEGNRPIGPQMTPDLYASQYRAEAAQRGAERAAGQSQRLAVMSAARMAQLMGLLLVVVGFGVFALS